MKIKKHALNDIWESHPEILSNNFKPLNSIKIEELLTQIFTSGPFYYYTLNVLNSTITHYNDDILKLHGITKMPNHVKDVIDLIHPEDIEFVRQAENWTLIKMAEIGHEHQLNLKSGYCFRMKVEDGSYQLFHHQAIHTQKDENGRLIQTINIHTNIHHITQRNNFVATLSGFGYQKDFFQHHFEPKEKYKPVERLTKRELEVTILVSKGYSDREISDLMSISIHTTRTHRKNILKKTMTKNGSELVKKCIELGYI